MKRKSAPAPKSGPAPAKARWLGLSLAALAVASVGAGVTWRWVQTENLRARLPSGPVDTGVGDALQERLRAAGKAARANPREAEALAELGRLYHANGYTVEALACWELLRGLEPEQARWPHYAADALRTLGRYDEMIAALSAAAERAPTYAPIPLQMAEYQLKTGAVTEAAANYQRRLALVPDDPYASLGQARCAFQAGRTREAQASLRKLVESRPGFASAHNFYAEILAAAGDLEGAERQRREGRAAGRFREAEDPWLLELRAWCLDPRRLVALGTVEFQNGELGRARELFERAARLEPANLRNQEVLGDLYMKMGETEKALAALQTYVREAGAKLPPPMVYVNLSELLRQTGQREQALRVTDEGLARGGEVPELVNARGVALMGLGRTEEARAAFERAIGIDDLDTTANFNLGSLLLGEGKIEEGVARLRRSLVRQPRFVDALALLGQVYLDQGDLATAGEYLRMLWEAQPKMPVAIEGMALWHFRSGQAAEKQGKTSEAESHYEAGLALRPESVELNRALGVLRLLGDRLELAFPTLQQLHRLAPRDAQANFFLAQALLRLGRIEEARPLLTEAARLATEKGNRELAGVCREILNTIGGR